MIVSTKGRYALRVMIDMAEHDTGAYIPLMDIAKRQEISEKYLESIVSLLSKSGLVSALRGKGGGYRLNRPASDYTVWDILRVTEGALAPVSCLEGENNLCKRAAECRTLGMWTELHRLVRGYFAGITLADLLRDNGAEAPNI